MRGAWILAGFVLLGTVACGNDEDAGDVVTEEEYAAEAERLCDQHGAVLEEAYVEPRADSDAEEAAFYTTDFVPRARALITRLGSFGFPPDKDEEYRASLNDALAALQAIQDEPYRYIDQRHRQELSPEDDLVNRVRNGLAGADVPC